MNSRILLSLSIPCVCFVAAWATAHALRPGVPAGGKEHRIKISYNATVSVARPDAARRLAEAMATSPPGEWRALWDAFAATAGTEELMAVAVERVPGAPQDADGFTPLRALAWEELAERMPEGFPELARRAARRDPALVAAAAATLASHDPKAAWALVSATASPKVRNAVLSTIAWNDPEEALRLYRTLPPVVPTVEDQDGPSAEEAVFITWARRDPAAAAEAMLVLPKGSKTPAAMLMTWARVDAVAALDFATRRLDGNEVAGRYPMDRLIMAALRQSPAEAVKRIAADPALRAVCEQKDDSGFNGHAMALWCEADPQAFLTSLRAGELKRGERGSVDFALSILRRGNFEAAAKLMEQLQPGDLRDPAYHIGEFAQREAALGPPLEAHFGVKAPEPPAISLARYNPVAACEAWLAALEKHSPDEAASACGFSPHDTVSLAVFAMTEMPDKARALAARVPWESLDISRGGVDADELSDLRRVWGQPEEKAAIPVVSQDWLHAGGSDQLEADPAGCAAKLNRDALGEWDGWNAVVNWAPHDFEAATAWVKSLPAGEARDRAEVGLALELSVRDPAAALKILEEAPPSALQMVYRPGARAWLSAVQQVMFTGGDWEAWLERTPPVLKEEVEELKAGVFDKEAELLATLRRAK